MKHKYDMRHKLSKEEINDALSKRGIVMIDEYTDTKTKTTFECGCGHQWTTKLNSIRSGCGCPKCAGKHQPSTSEFNEWLSYSGRKMKIIGEYVNSMTKTMFECDCGHQWSTTPSSIKSNNSGCSNCSSFRMNPNKPAWEYIFIRDGYLKYGITNNLNRRISQHEKHGSLNLVHKRYHEIGQYALDWENNIKRTHGGRYVTKEQCPDGYTETLPIHLLECLAN